jgi:hypothetical protein
MIGDAMGKISLFILVPVFTVQMEESNNFFTPLFSHQFETEEYIPYLLTPFKFKKIKEFHHKYSGIRQIFMGIDLSKFFTINENDEMVVW